LPILKYDANQDKLVEQKGETLDEEEKRTKMEGEKEPKTPLQMALKEGEDLKARIMNVIGQMMELVLNHNIKRNVGHHDLSIITSTFTTKDHQQNCKYLVSRMNLKMFRK